MNGELLAAVVLAAHGTAWLRDPDAGPAPQLDRDHPVFQFVGAARFRPPRSRWRQPTDIIGVAAWLTSLRARGVDRLWLLVPEAAPAVDLPDHVAVAFSGGGSWLLLATGPGLAQAWNPVWELDDRDAPDQAIWGISCTGTTLDAPVTPPASDPTTAEARLTDALHRIVAFARAEDETHWAEFFARALVVPEADEAIAAGSDVLPRDAYPPVAYRLLAMASSAWAFGGMGSWNDLGFDTAESHAEYEAVSSDLYAAIMGAVVAAVNAPPR